MYSGIKDVDSVCLLHISIAFFMNAQKLAWVQPASFQLHFLGLFVVFVRIHMQTILIMMVMVMVMRMLMFVLVFLFMLLISDFIQTFARKFEFLIRTDRFSE